MTMTSTSSWIAVTLTAAALALGWSSTGLAQDKPKDESLEKLLEKLGEADKPTPDKPTDADKDKDKEKDKPTKADPTKPKDSAPTDKPKPAGEVAPKDQELDKLLEGLGQTKETPSADDKKPGGGGGPDDPMPPKSDKPQPPELKDGEKDIDKRLTDITGKKEPKKDKKKGDGDAENGPLGQVIKEMRDVEQRLGEPDTGEGTRQKQTEIVKNLDQLIEQMKNAPSQSSALKMMRGETKPGGQSGTPKGDQPGAMAQGTPPSKPTDPKKPNVAAGLDKSIWGQLPTQFREQMGNADSEFPLPAKFELIRQYYLSLVTKNSKRED